jgi:hypothetical protein
MESSSNKIILIQYKIQISNFYYYNFATILSKYFIITNSQKIVKSYISDIEENNLIIEVILKDQ